MYCWRKNKMNKLDTNNKTIKTNRLLKCIQEQSKNCT